MRYPTIVGVAVVATVLTGAVRPAQAQSDVVLQSLNLQGVNYNAATRTLTATGGTVAGTIGGLPFVTDITHFNLQAQPGNGMGRSVLDLGLAPIHIELLGLHVDTSA